MSSIKINTIKIFARSLVKEKAGRNLFKEICIYFD